jgi:nitrogen regulatory protein PII-like uncharacterized protein
MKRDETIERIKSCMAMESVCASVYHLLSLNFEEEKELWIKLARDEESHAAMIASVIDFRDSENLADFPVPEDFENIRSTIAYADETRRLLVNNKLSLREVLERLQKMNELKSRSYFHDLLEREHDEKVKSFFQRLFRIDKSNMDIIGTFIDKFKE